MLEETYVRKKCLLGRIFYMEIVYLFDMTFSCENGYQVGK